ncbi:dipeptide epimerase [Natronomonas salina]|uniref:dipeptide epimerase n=1 Tax=Natronomonas salina TaxID=1710540 RepID=UPI0015B50791|nr:dipeptide epimerase [Natronomonas salina]QLD90821.1 dipeptide epimerase [Natronomonas salina]
MNPSFETVELALDVPFTIARGTTTTTENVVVEIEHEGETGYGAAAPSRHYGETAATVEALLPELLEVVASVSDPHARREIHDRMDEVARENPAAKAAVDVALWDLAGKLLDQPVYRLLGLSADSDGCPPTSFTVGLDDTRAMTRRARQAADAGYPILKVKLGTDRDLRIVEAIRAVAPDVTLRVDANEAWTPTEAVRKCEALAEYGVEFVEQPVPAENPSGLRHVHERSPLPIAADESCLTADDVPAVADRCDVANLKLMKTGGLTPALELIHAGRAHGLEVMCGCMIETNAAIAGAAHLLPLLDYADLDGSLLLESDSFGGIEVTEGQFDLQSVQHGTGATPR